VEAASQLQITEENHRMISSRYFLASIAAAALMLAGDPVLAVPPTVEIIAMAHPPVVAALKPLRDWLARQDGKLRVIELDAESPAGAKRLAAISLTGHVPMAILIDGKPHYRRKDGTTVSFVNFPAAKESPSGIRGDWLVEDVQAAITERMNEP
jgi:hypothetical protein